MGLFTFLRCYSSLLRPCRTSTSLAAAPGGVTSRMRQRPPGEFFASAALSGALCIAGFWSGVALKLRRYLLGGGHTSRRPVTIFPVGTPRGLTVGCPSGLSGACGGPASWGTWRGKLEGGAGATGPAPTASPSPAAPRLLDPSGGLGPAGEGARPLVLTLPPPLRRGWPGLLAHGSYLVDSASSHMLVSKIKPCMSKYKQLYRETANGSLNQLSFI